MRIQRLHEEREAMRYWHNTDAPTDARLQDARVHVYARVIHCQDPNRTRRVLPQNTAQGRDDRDHVFCTFPEAGPVHQRYIRRQISAD